MSKGSTPGENCAYKAFHFIFMLFVAIELLSYITIFCAIFYGIRTKGGFLLIFKLLNGNIGFI